MKLWVLLSFLLAFFTSMAKPCSCESLIINTELKSNEHSCCPEKKNIKSDLTESSQNSQLQFEHAFSCVSFCCATFSHRDNANLFFHTFSTQDFTHKIRYPYVVFLPVLKRPPRTV